MNFLSRFIVKKIKVKIVSNMEVLISILGRRE